MAFIQVYDVKLCDFGLSRVVDRDKAMTSNIGTRFRSLDFLVSF